MKPAAVLIESSSSSSVVAPSLKPEMVRVATRIGSTPSRPTLQRSTARTILFTSTGSKSPFLFLTFIAEPDAGPRACSVSSRSRRSSASAIFIIPFRFPS